MDENNISTSTSTIRSLHGPDVSVSSASQPSSPSQNGLPSPSPSSISSSLPSDDISSSFLFSSAAASPPHTSDHSKDDPQDLIIPHLTLPPALRKPSVYGQSLGALRILCLGSTRGAIASLLFDDNEDIVDVSQEESEDGLHLTRASTDWIEHSDAHGLEKFEPTRNIEIIEFTQPYDHDDEALRLAETMKHRIEETFHSISELLDRNRESTAVLSNLVSSASTVLYTALIFFTHSPPSDTEQLIIDNLGPIVPIIPIAHQHRALSSPKLSSFHPPSIPSLRTGIFRSPDVVGSIRDEAAHRFIRWWEVERMVIKIQDNKSRSTLKSENLWSKAQWETELDLSLSSAVVHRLRQDEASDDCKMLSSPISTSNGEVPHQPFDPLHLPSLFLFSLSLIGPLRRRIGTCIGSLVPSIDSWPVALVGGFCLGLGVGFYIKWH